MFYFFSYSFGFILDLVHVSFWFYVVFSSILVSVPYWFDFSFWFDFRFWFDFSFFFYFGLVSFFFSFEFHFGFGSISISI